MAAEGEPLKLCRLEGEGQSLAGEVIKGLRSSRKDVKLKYYTSGFLITLKNNCRVDSFNVFLSQFKICFGLDRKCNLELPKPSLGSNFLKLNMQYRWNWRAYEGCDSDLKIKVSISVHSDKEIRETISKLEKNSCVANATMPELPFGPDGEGSNFKPMFHLNLDHLIFATSS